MYENKASTLTREQKNQLARLTADRWADTTADIQPLLDDSKRAWDYYLNNRHRGNATTRQSKLAQDVGKHSQSTGARLSTVPKVVSSVVSQQHTTTFPNDDRFFRGTPRNDLSKQLQEIYESNLGHRMAKKNLTQEYHKARLTNALDGTVCVYVYHDQEKLNKIMYEPEVVPMYDPLVGMYPMETGNVLETRREVVTYDGPCMEVLNFTDWRMDPKGTSYDKAWFIRRWYLMPQRVKEKFPDAPKELLKPYRSIQQDEFNSSQRDKFDSLGITWRSIDSYEEEEGKQYCLLMTHYDDFVIDGKEYKNHLCVVLNDYDVIYFGENPYNHGRRPYLVCPYYSVPGSLYGLSLVKHALASAELIDKSYLYILQQSSWAAFPVFKKSVMDPTLNKLGEIEISPGKIIPMTSTDSLQQLEVNTANIQLLYNIIDTATKNIEEITGANSLMSGGDPERSRVSAFEIDTRTQAGLVRHQVPMETFNNLLLEPSIQMMFENDRQYKEVSEFVDGIQLDPNTIKLLDFDFVVVSIQATLTRNKRIQQALQLLTEIMPTMFSSGLASPNPQGLVLDHIEALKMLLHEGGFQNLPQIMKTIGQGEMAQLNLQQQAIPAALPGLDPGGVGDMAPNEQYTDKSA